MKMSAVRETQVTTRKVDTVRAHKQGHGFTKMVKRGAAQSFHDGRVCLLSRGQAAMFTRFRHPSRRAPRTRVTRGALVPALLPRIRRQPSGPLAQFCVFGKPKACALRHRRRTPIPRSQAETRSDSPGAQQLPAGERRVGLRHLFLRPSATQTVTTKHLLAFHPQPLHAGCGDRLSVVGCCANTRARAKSSCSGLLIRPALHGAAAQPHRRDRQRARRNSQTSQMLLTGDESLDRAPGPGSVQMPTTLFMHKLGTYERLMSF